MEEVASDLLKPLARIFLAIVRVLIWLAWDLMIQTIGWGIGWMVCRVVTLGKLPKERITEVDSAPPIVAFLVELVAMAFLLFIAYFLTKYVG